MVSDQSSVRTDDHGQRSYRKPNANGLSERFSECAHCRRWCSAVGAYTFGGKYVCTECIEKLQSTTCSHNFVKLDVPDLYASAELSDLRPIALQRTISRWPDTSRLLIFHGPTGYGKTHAAWALAKTEARKQRKVFLLDCKDARNKWVGCLRTEERPRLIKVWSGIPYLILDAFADAPATEGWSNALLELVDNRLKWNKATIIIINISGGDMSKLYGPDMRSRMHHFEGVDFSKGIDWRKRLEVQRETANHSSD